MNLKSSTQHSLFWALFIPFCLLSCTAKSEKEISSPEKESNKIEKGSIVVTEKKPLSQKENAKLFPVSKSDTKNFKMSNVSLRFVEKRDSSKIPKSYKAYKISQINQIFGPQTVYLSKTWIMTKNIREGTTYFRELGDKHLVIFNAKKKVYFEGTGLHMRKRIVLLTKLTKTDLADLQGIGSKWKSERKIKFLGRKTEVYSAKDSGKVWKLWTAKDLGIKPAVYHDYVEWSKLPELGGMPLKLVSYGANGKNTVYLDTTSISETKLSSKELEVPRDCKRVKNLFQVSSGRTEQLMESFSEILGD